MAPNVLIDQHRIYLVSLVVLSRDTFRMDVSPQSWVYHHVTRQVQLVKLHRSRSRLFSNTLPRGSDIS